MKSHTAYLTFKTNQRREFVRITEDVQAAVEEAGVAGRDGARLSDAHHRRGLGQRRRARHPRGRARMARQTCAAELEQAFERHRRVADAPTPATTAITAAARTTATPT